GLDMVWASPAHVRAKADAKATKVFIGHGGSTIWRELKEFLEKVGLEVVEYNAIPTPGKSRKERLLEMLDECGFAFVVMTAEDERGDGKLHPRENVTHEAGLFQ